MMHLIQNGNQRPTCVSRYRVKGNYRQDKYNSNRTNAKVKKKTNEQERRKHEVLQKVQVTAETENSRTC